MRDMIDDAHKSFSVKLETHHCDQCKRCSDFMNVSSYGLHLSFHLRVRKGGWGWWCNTLSDKWGRAAVLPDIVRETSKRAYENKPKTSDFSFRGRIKKKKRERDYCTLHTHKYHPESRNIFVFIIIFICYDPFCFSTRTSKQYDMQYNRKRNTSSKTCNPRLPIFISDFAEKQAQSRL